MAVTMKDIAKHCGVSEGAVSQVLRNPEHPRFSEATRQLIRETANRLDYRQNRLSLALSSKKTNMIGLMLPWNQPEVMDNIERLVSASGYKLMLQFTAHPREGAELEALKSFLDWNVDGIIWEPSSVTHDDFLPELNRIQRKGPPLVLLERGIEGFNFPVVKTDYTPIIKDCINHLQQQGYERIAFVSFNPKSVQSIWQQIRAEAEQLKLKFKLYHLASSTEIVSFADQCQEILREPETPNTAFICHSWCAADMVRALEREKINAPRDIGLAMVQDLLIGGRLRLSTLLRPEVTSCRVNSAELVTCAVNRLLAEIDRKPVKSNSLCINAEFVIQESTIRHRS